MAMRKRTRSKGLRKSEKLLGAGTDAREYGIAVIGPDPRRTLALMVMLLAVAIALSFVFLGVIIIPGVLLMVAIFGAIDRPASIAITNQGVAVFARSEFNGRPRKVLTVFPQGALADRTVLREGAHVHLPELHLWFRKKEYERLLVAGNIQLVTDPMTVPVPVPAGVVARGGPGPGPGAPTGAPTVARSPVRNTMGGLPASDSENVSRVIYCSWCGKQRALNAQAIHHCGSMDRPAVYCMNCGASLEEGAPSCTSCGTFATQISR
jgi:hypothetical protein